MGIFPLVDRYNIQNLPVFSFLGIVYTYILFRGKSIRKPLIKNGSGKYCTGKSRFPFCQYYKSCSQLNCGRFIGEFSCRIFFSTSKEIQTVRNLEKGSYNVIGV